MKSTHLELNPRLLNEMPFPATVRENLQRMNSKGANLIQRVSEESFLVRNREMTQAHPRSLLHVRFSKNKTPSSAPPIPSVRAQFLRDSLVLELSPVVPQQHLEFQKGVYTFTSASGLLLPMKSSLRSILASASLNSLKQDLKVRILLAIHCMAIKCTICCIHIHMHILTLPCMFIS